MTPQVISFFLATEIYPLVIIRLILRFSVRILSSVLNFHKNLKNGKIDV